MKKILVVFTGGTIGSRIHNSTIDVNEEAGYSLIKLFQDRYHYDVEFDTLQPLHMLSENITPEHWGVLYDLMRDIPLGSYAGIIVTHGTDTLPYTSAALGFLFHHTPVPIIITGSNYPLERENSNGFSNFSRSVEFIINAAIPGVFALFQDNTGRNAVYLASRIMEADSYNDQYPAFGGVYFGEIKEGRFKPEENRINPSPGSLVQSGTGLLKGPLTFQNQILAIRPYPGLNYDFFRFGNKPRAVLHSLYHSGTGCINASSNSLPAFIKRCREEGTDFYLMSFKNIDQDLYRTSRELLACGATPLRNISFEAAYVKLCIAYNQNVMPPQEYVLKELFHEFLQY